MNPISTFGSNTQLILKCFHVILPHKKLWLLCIGYYIMPYMVFWGPTQHLDTSWLLKAALTTAYSKGARHIDSRNRMETRHSSETEQWKTGVKGGLTGNKAPSGTEQAGGTSRWALSQEVGAFGISHIKFEVPAGKPGENIQKEETQWVSRLGSQVWPRMINRGVSIRGTHAPGGQPFFCCTIISLDLKSNSARGT